MTQIQTQVDRYQTIMHPFSSRPSLSATLAIIAALDLVSLLVLAISLFLSSFSSSSSRVAKSDLNSTDQYFAIKN